MQIARIRQGRQRRMAHHDRVNAPADKNDHHDRDQLHDVQGFFAGFRNCPWCFPTRNTQSPIIAEARGDDVDGSRGKRAGRQVRVGQKFAEKPADVLSGSHAADRTGQNVIEHQCRYVNFASAPPKDCLTERVNATAPNMLQLSTYTARTGVGKQHDRQDEPRRGLADVAFRFTARVISRRCQVVQNDGSGPPERNET